MTMQEMLHTGERVLAHIVAIVAGLVLMLVGIGMGVTIALMPLAIPLCALGLGLLVWGFARDRARRSRR